MNRNQIFNLQKSYLNRVFQVQELSVNAFAGLLYRGNWSWEEKIYPILPASASMLKSGKMAKSSLKTDILAWFKSLKPAEKTSCSAIINQDFIAQAIKIQPASPNLVYCLHRCVHSFKPVSISVGTGRAESNPQENSERIGSEEMKSGSVAGEIWDENGRNLKNWEEENQSKMIIENLRLSALKECILWLEEGVVEGLLDWLEQISKGHIFEYAHKTLNRNEPEYNLLWFSPDSFQPFTHWLAAEFEKSILANYFSPLSHQSLLPLQFSFAHHPLMRHNFIQIQPADLESPLRLNLLTLEEEHHELASKQLFEKLRTESSQLLPQKKQHGRKKVAHNSIQREEAKLEVKKKTKKRKKKINQIIISQTTVSIEVNLSQSDKQPDSPSNLETKKSLKSSKSSKAPKSSKLAKSPKELKSLKSDSNQNAANIKILLADKIGQNEKNQGKDEMVEMLGSEENRGEEKNMGSEQVLVRDKIGAGISENSFRSEGTTDSVEKERELVGERELLEVRENKEEEERKQVKSSGNTDMEPESLELEERTEAERSFEIAPEEFYELEDEEDARSSSPENPQEAQPPKKKKKRNGSRGGKKTEEMEEWWEEAVKSALNHKLNIFIDRLSMESNSYMESKVVAFERVRCFVMSLFPQSEVLLFGSNAIGLALPTSDIDIMIVNLPCQFREELSDVLDQIAEEMESMAWVTSCSRCLSAKVPILKLEIDTGVWYTARKNGELGALISFLDPFFTNPLQARSVKVDLSVSIFTQDHLCPQSTLLMRNWIKQQPIMHRVLLALKYILASNSFNENFTGGIGSYCLFVMVAAYLTEFVDQSTDEISLFLQILKFYGSEFQDSSLSISLANKGFCFQKLLTTTFPSAPIRIFDPLNGRLMSGHCSLYPKIKAEFLRLHELLLYHLESIRIDLLTNKHSKPPEKIPRGKKSVDQWAEKYGSKINLDFETILNSNLQKQPL